MRIVSNTYEGFPILPSINQSKSVSKGGIYELSITEAGVWSYHNIDNKDAGIIGIIYVR